MAKLTRVTSGLVQHGLAHADSDRAQLRLKTTTANANTIYYTFQYYIR